LAAARLSVVIGAPSWTACTISAIRHQRIDIVGIHKHDPVADFHAVHGGVDHGRQKEVGLGLGAQAGEERLRKVAREAGFSNLRRAAQTPVNLILELTP
jgi:hypothetical protein